jgi:hypothetical protein
MAIPQISDVPESTRDVPVEVARDRGQSLLSLLLSVVTAEAQRYRNFPVKVFCWLTWMIHGSVFLGASRDAGPSRHAPEETSSTLQ